MAPPGAQRPVAAPQPSLLDRTAERGRRNIVDPLGDAWNRAATGARTVSRAVVVDVRPFEGLDELKQVCFLMPAWRVRLDTTVPGGGLGVPGRTPGGAPVQVPMPIPIR